MNQSIRKIIVTLFLVSGSAFANWGPACVHYQEIAWNQLEAQVEVSCNDTIGVSAKNYYYKWSQSGNSMENAKAMLSIILLAKSTGQRLRFYRGTLTNNWYPFSAVSILD